MSTKGSLIEVDTDLTLGLSLDRGQQRHTKHFFPKISSLFFFWGGGGLFFGSLGFPLTRQKNIFFYCWGPNSSLDLWGPGLR